MCVVDTAGDETCEECEDGYGSKLATSYTCDGKTWTSSLNPVWKVLDNVASQKCIVILCTATHDL